MAGDRDTSSLTTCERLVYFCVLHLHTQVLWPYESVLLTSQVRPLSMGAGRCVALWVENEQQRTLFFTTFTVVLFPIISSAFVSGFVLVIFDFLLISSLTEA